MALRQRRGERFCRLTSTGCFRATAIPTIRSRGCGWAACGWQDAGADHLRADLAFGNFAADGDLSGVVCGAAGAPVAAVGTLASKANARGGPMHFGIVSTSYPRFAGDPAGGFVHGLNRHLHRRASRQRHYVPVIPTPRCLSGWMASPCIGCRRRCFPWRRSRRTGAGVFGANRSAPWAWRCSFPSILCARWRSFGPSATR